MESVSVSTVAQDQLRDLGPRAAWCALAFVLAVTLAGGEARAADAQGCPEDVPAWIERAAREADVRLSVDGCFDDIVRLRLGVPGGPTIPVELSPHPARAFRAAGRYGLSPIIDVQDFSALPADWRRAFDRLAAWIATHEREPLVQPVVADVRRGGGGTLPLPLLAALALALATAGVLIERRGRAPAPDRRAWLAAYAGITAIALAVRLLFGPWESFHGNGHGPLWIAWLYRPDELRPEYGHGYVELYHWLARAAGTHVEQAVFAANATLGALTATAALGLARSLGMTLRVALIASLLFALEPLAVRMDASESYLVPIMCGVLTAALLAARGIGALERHARVQAALFLGATGFVVAQTARIHPCGWAALALVPLVAFARAPAGAAHPDPSPRGLRSAALAAARAGGVIAAIVAVFSGPTLWNVWRSARALPAVTDGQLRLTTAGLTTIVALVAGAGLLALRRPARSSLMWAIPAVLLAGVTAALYAALPLFFLAYQTLFLPAVIMAVAWAIPPRALERSPWFVAAAALPPVLLAVTWARLAPIPTDGLENRLIRAFVRAMPRDCAIAWVERVPPRRVLELPLYEGLAVGARPPSIRLAGSGGALDVHAYKSRCIYYYRGSLCHSAEGAPVCRAVEGDVPLTPVAAWSLPARPSMRDLRYDSDPVVVEMFQLSRP